jgi:stage II sporulation protein M
MNKNKDKKRGCIRRSLKDSLKFISESWRYIKIIIYVFVASFFIGLILPASNFILDILNDIIKNLLAKTQNLDTIGLIKYIFINNFSISALSIFLGVLLGVVPIILALTNGYFIGLVSHVSISQDGIFSLWRLFPHGIFELPAVIIALGIGLNLGVSLFNYDSSKSFFRKLVLVLKTLILIILPLLVFAALIEGLLISFSLSN